VARLKVAIFRQPAEDLINFRQCALNLNFNSALNFGFLDETFPATTSFFDNFPTSQNLGEGAIVPVSGDDTTVHTHT